MANQDINKALPPAFIEAAKDKEKEKDEPEKKDEPKKEDAEKAAVLTEDDLKKSLHAIEGIVSSSPSARRDQLFAKSQSGAISATENAELIRILSGQNVGGLGEGVSKAFESETLAKAVDVAPYLDELHTDIGAALGLLSTHVEKSDAARQEQVVVLAKAIHDIGTAQIEHMKLVKAIGERLGLAMRQPARAPRAVGAGALEKAFAGQPQGGELSKAQVMDLLFQMNVQSPDGISKSGEPYTDAVAKFEQLNQISPPLLAEVQNFYKRSRDNGHAGR